MSAVTRRVLLALVVLATLDGCAESEAPPTKQPPRATPAAEATAATTGDIADADAAALYARHCGACHDAGDGHPGTMRIAARGDGSDPVLLERTDLTAAYVALTIRSGMQMMPPFRPSELTDAEIAPLAAYVAKHYAGSP